MTFYTFKLKHILLWLGGLCALCVCIALAGRFASVGTQARLLPVYSVDTPKKQVALTFDCAWEDADTDAVLQVLSERNVKATFFVTGDFVDRCGESVKKFHAAGHEIANHSDMHPHVNALTKEQLHTDTANCSDKIETLLGVRPTLYRAPYGEYNNKVIQTITDMGLSCIQWDCDSLDYKNPSAETMQARILKNLQNGSILLFHTGTKGTASALGPILDAVTARGFTIGTVGDLIYKDGFYIDANGRQKLK